MRDHRLTRFFVLTFLLVTVHWSLVTGISWACPLCKEALADPAQAQTVSRLAKGYAVSIAALIGVPFFLVGGVATMLVRSTRRREKVPGAL